MSNSREETGYTKAEPLAEQTEMFGDLVGDPGERMMHSAKLSELRRELAMRKNVYPRLLSAGKLTQKAADEQVAALESIVEDYNIRVWPQTKDFVKEWRDQAERITFMGVQVRLMHREELLAVVAYAKAALEETTP